VPAVVAGGKDNLRALPGRKGRGEQWRRFIHRLASGVRNQLREPPHQSKSAKGNARRRRRRDKPRGGKRRALPFADFDWCRRLAELIANSTRQTVMKRRHCSPRPFRPGSARRLSCRRPPPPAPWRLPCDDRQMRCGRSESSPSGAFFAPRDAPPPRRMKRAAAPEALE